MDAGEAIRLQFMAEYAHKDFTDITGKGLCAAAVVRTAFWIDYGKIDAVFQKTEDEQTGSIRKNSDRQMNSPVSDGGHIRKRSEQSPPALQQTKRCRSSSLPGSGSRASP